MTWHCKHCGGFTFHFIKGEHGVFSVCAMARSIVLELYWQEQFVREILKEERAWIHSLHGCSYAKPAKNTPSGFSPPGETE